MPARLLASLFPVLLLAAGLAGCASTGDVGNPFVRKATWYSYLNGDDLRPACVPGAPDVARLVLNGRYDQQVRIYQMEDDGAGDWLLDIRVIGPGDLTRLSLSDPSAPWRGDTARVRIGRAGADTVWAALRASRALEAAPDGLSLLSDRLYWVAVGCRGGQVFFHAWQHPSPAWDGLVFPQVLAGYDVTGIAFPSEEAPPAVSLEAPRNRDRGAFRLEVGPTGFKYLGGPLR